MQTRLMDNTIRRAEECLHKVNVHISAKSKREWTHTLEDLDLHLTNMVPRDTAIMGGDWVNTNSETDAAIVDGQPADEMRAFTTMHRLKVMGSQQPTRRRWTDELPSRRLYFSVGSTSATATHSHVSHMSDPEKLSDHEPIEHRGQYDRHHMAQDGEAVKV